MQGDFQAEGFIRKGEAGSAGLLTRVGLARPGSGASSNVRGSRYSSTLIRTQRPEPRCLPLVSDGPVSCLPRTLGCSTRMQVRRKDGEPKGGSEVGVRKPLRCSSFFVKLPYLVSSELSL